MIGKIFVDGDRTKFIPTETSSTRNAVSGIDYTSFPPGAVTMHINDNSAIQVCLVSKASYGKSDSTYVYSIQKYDPVDDITYVGEFNYVVKARPADVVIDLGEFTMPVLKSEDTRIDIQPVSKALDLHAKYYKRYPRNDVAADFASGIKVDSRKITINGKSAEASVHDYYSFYLGSEKSYISLRLNRAGKWKVQLNTHFAGVGYTFIVTVIAS